MQLSYLTPTKTMIVAHLGAGETLGTLTEGTGYIKVDGTDPNYAALLEVDPNLESVVDPGEVRLPPAAAPPTLSSLSPDTAVAGDADLTLSCTGSGFTAASVIVFGAQDEPTTLVSDTEVTTVVKPSLFTPATVPVTVRDAGGSSASLDFVFSDPAEQAHGHHKSKK